MKASTIDFFYKPLIRDPEDVWVIKGNGEALYFKGFAILLVALSSTLV